jgi:hypothetical protein
MDIQKLDLVQLKALVYDEMVKQQLISQNMQVINAEIAKRNQTLPEERTSETLGKNKAEEVD